MPDFVSDNLNGAEFEASVRHVARQLYRHANSTGSIKLDGRERDEIIDTGTELIVVEATQSRKLDKTKYDLEKKALVWCLNSEDLMDFQNIISEYSLLPQKTLQQTRIRM